VVLLNDLLEGRLGPYRLLVIPQLAYLVEERCRRLKQYVDETDTSVFWFHAPGALGDGGSGHNTRALSGFSSAVEWSTGHLDAIIAPAEHWLTRGVAPGTAYGSSTGLADREQVALGWVLDQARIGPRAAIADADVVALAHLPSGGTALAVRESARRFDVLSTVPAPPALIVRNAAEQAGVHLYMPMGDSVYAGRSFIGVVAGSDGPQTISLPKDSRVTDLLTGQVLIERGRIFQLTLRAHHCALLLVE